jgi:hypothetical protein
VIDLTINTKKLARFVAAGVIFGSMVTATVGAGALSGTPEVDRANALLTLSGTLKVVSCTGEDATSYETLSGTWTGNEIQSFPDPTDYNLTASLTVTGIKWTINMANGMGVLTGHITLAPAGLHAIYAGTLTLVTQGTAGTQSAAGRGWISAAMKLADDGATTGLDDHLIANVEFPTMSSTAANGWFGTVAASTVPDYSAVTNVAPTAADGTC